MNKDRFVTVLTVEQIDDRIKQCEKNIEIFQNQTRNQEQLRSELLLMKIQTMPTN